MTTVIQTDIVIAVRVTTTLQPGEKPDDAHARLHQAAGIYRMALVNEVEIHHGTVVDHTEGGWSVTQRELVPK